MTDEESLPIVPPAAAVAAGSAALDSSAGGPGWYCVRASIGLSVADVSLRQDAGILLCLGTKATSPSSTGGELELCVNIDPSRDAGSEGYNAGGQVF